MGSIQFNTAVFLAKSALTERGYINVSVPQAKPRSKGEVLGCTSPVLKYEVKPDCIFVCDGRFHMEAAMIANEELTFFQYNPYNKQFSLEQYDCDLMKKMRLEVINKAKSSKKVGIVFGILGRQGNKDVLENIQKVLEKAGRSSIVILLSELKNEHVESYKF